MKPIKLEIFLQEGISSELKMAELAVQEFSNDSKKRLQDVTEAVKLQCGIVKELENHYKELEKSLKHTDFGQQWIDVKEQIAKVRTELDTEKTILHELTEQQRVLSFDAGKADMPIQMQIHNIRDEISSSLLAYRSLTEEEKQSPQGKRITHYIDELIKSASVLNESFARTSHSVQSRGVVLNEAGVVEDVAPVKTPDQSHLTVIREHSEEVLKEMLDYLLQSQPMELQRQLQSQKYDEEIKNAQSEDERKQLENEKDAAMSNMTFEHISMGIDWHELLGNVKSLSREMLTTMLDQLIAYTKGVKYVNADMAERKEVWELITELRQYLDIDTNTGWEELSMAISDFTTAVAEYKDLSMRYQNAIETREKAKSQLEHGEIIQEDFDKINSTADGLGLQTEEAEKKVQAFGVALNETAKSVKNYVSPLTAALDKLSTWNGIAGFSEIKTGVASIDRLKGMTDSVLPSDIGDDGLAAKLEKKISSKIDSGLGVLGKSVTSLLSDGIGNVIGIIAQIPKLILDVVKSIKNMVTGVLDSFTELISLKWIEDIVNGILNSLGRFINAIFDLPENLYKVVESIMVNGVGGVLNTILGRLGNVLSFGFLGSGGPADWFSNSNGKEVLATINRLTERNKLLNVAIEDLTDEIKASKGTKSVSAYKEAYGLQKERNANYLEMAMAQAGYHGAHHSWSHYWEGFTSEEIAKLSEQIGRLWDGNIWNLLPEEMKKLRSNIDMWTKIQNTGKGGYGKRLTDKLDDYIDQAGKLETLTNQLYEGLTGISFDSMYGSFVNRLMDMKSSAKDFADDISEYFTRALISNKIGELYADRLEEWWKKFGVAMEDGDLSDTELNELSEEYMGYVEEAMRLRDEIAAATGYGNTDNLSTNQTGKAGGFYTMSQEQGTKLEGLFSSLQGHVAHIDAVTEDVVSKMSTAEGYLVKIADNTKVNAVAAGEIRDMIIKIVRDGLKTR